MRQVVAGLALAAALAGCGASASVGNQSGHNWASALAQTIQSDAPSQIQKQDPTATLANVECVRSGNTQSYSCLGDLASGGSTSKISFSGTCDNAGNCTWQSTQ